MNITFKIFSLLAVIAMAFAAVSPALAQKGTPPKRGDGPLSEFFAAAIAEVFGIDVEKFKARRANGERLMQIIQSLDLGYDLETIKSMMETVGSTAVSQAVSAGAITQDQADRMANRERNKGQFGGGPRGGALLEKLGLTQEELKAALDQGLTMREIFEQQDVGFGTFGPGKGTRDRAEGPGGMLAEQCELSAKEIRSRIQAGEALQDICPGVELPEFPNFKNRKGNWTQP